MAANATLGGNGSLAGNVTIAGSGTLSPGTSVGNFTMTGNVTIDANGFFNVEYNTTSQTIDLATISGTFSINGGTINFVNETGIGVLTGPSYTLATFTGGTRTYTAANVPVGYYLVDTGSSLVLQQIPEAGALLSLGLIALVSGIFTTFRRHRTAG